MSIRELMNRSALQPRSPSRTAAGGMGEKASGIERDLHQEIVLDRVQNTWWP